MIKAACNHFHNKKKKVLKKKKTTKNFNKKEIRFMEKLGKLIIKKQNECSIKIARNFFLDGIKYKNTISEINFNLKVCLQTNICLLSEMEFKIELSLKHNLDKAVLFQKNFKPLIFCGKVIIN